MQNVTAAAKVVAAAAADDTTVAWVGKLIAAVQTSAGLTGWSIQTLAADPNVQVPDALSSAAAPRSLAAPPQLCAMMRPGSARYPQQPFHEHAESELAPQSL